MASLNIVGQTLINVSHIAQRSREIVVNVSHIAHRSREMITYADISRAVGLYWTCNNLVQEDQGEDQDEEAIL